MTTIALIEDHKIFRDSLTGLINNFEKVYLVKDTLGVSTK